MPFESRPCTVCLVQHDEEIHAATLSVREWFRDQVMQGFYDEFTEDGPAPAALEQFQVA
jgi:hypothetical protein